MDQEPQNITVDTIYNYTESHIKSLEESITRIDARFSTFIGFSGVLIRLALDLPQASNTMRFLVCLFSVIAILISAIGLGSKQTGDVLHPSALMEDKYFYETEVYQKCLIINDRIKLTEEYEEVIKRKGRRLNYMICFFTIATIFYGIGVSGFDSFIYNFIKLQFPLKGFI
ncbi:hypothetical protein [Cyanobacterium aponinum]|uniref:hypothetical protein n=1 Tax=Cyanobacterium aponinum TaxID=379064 RepID=UPI000C12D1F2|nr:hypothetical protein [Cyanobacterium aponinum]PHV61490.1 hypothetical protein CSQ80_15285 [Cyanobacterium aponinum IPPAS B-1201]